jgi:hypothetical protein
MDIGDVELQCPHCQKRIKTAYGTFARHKNSCMSSTPKKKRILEGDDVIEISASDITSQVSHFFGCLLSQLSLIHVYLS